MVGVVVIVISPEIIPATVGIARLPTGDDKMSSPVGKRAISTVAAIALFPVLRDLHRRWRGRVVLWSTR